MKNYSEREEHMTRAMASLASADGVGVIRIEEPFEAAVADVWSALTDRGRLADWYGRIEGDLRVGSELRASLYASGWEGTVRIEACDPPRRIVVVARHLDDPREVSTEITLRAEDGRTVFALERVGLPLDLLWAYGAGTQIHVEDLAAHLAGGGRGESGPRFEDLEPLYRELAGTMR
jgi:uncharacterized protein YndB with AHSA1/START domain